MMEPVSAIKYEGMGQEDRALAMVTIGGGLSVKILKRTSNFSSRQTANCALSETAQSRIAIPKKTRLFVEQTIRERSEATKIHNTFQQGFLRLRLDVSKKAREVVNIGRDSGHNPVTVEASVLGLGPNYYIRTVFTNVSDDSLDPGLFLVFRDKDTDIQPRVTSLPLLPGGIPIPVTVKAIPKSKLAGRVQIHLCKTGRVRPIATSIVVLPVPEEDIEV